MRSSFVAILAMCALAACSPGTAPAGNTVKIGIDLPLSGADSAVGTPIENGAVLAVEQANAAGFAGGKFKVEADALDDTTQGLHDPAQGAQNVKTLIGDPAVLAVVGPYNSNVAKSEIPLTNDAGLAQISPATTADVLTIGTAAKALRQSHPDQIAFFRVCTRDAKQGSALAHFAHGLWTSIFTPGANAQLLLAMNLSFLALFLSLVFLLYASGFNGHVIALLVIALCLFASIQW